MQNLVLVQETSEKPVPPAPGRTRHLLPFHSSASERWRSRASEYPPAARQKEALTHEIPVKTASAGRADRSGKSDTGCPLADRCAALIIGAPGGIAVT
jgi:hypothetical protein